MMIPDYSILDGTVIEVIVDDDCKAFFDPPYLVQQIGIVVDKDDHHIWIRTIRTDIESGKSYLAGPDRYNWNHITIRGVK